MWANPRMASAGNQCRLGHQAHVGQLNNGQPRQEMALMMLWWPWRHKPVSPATSLPLAGGQRLSCGLACMSVHTGPKLQHTGVGLNLSTHEYAHAHTCMRMHTHKTHRHTCAHMHAHAHAHAHTHTHCTAYCTCKLSTPSSPWRQPQSWGCPQGRAWAVRMGRQTHWSTSAAHCRQPPALSPAAPPWGRRGTQRRMLTTC